MSLDGIGCVMHTYTLDVMMQASPSSRRVRAAVAGATGYAGQELVRLLARHPRADLTAAMASDTNGPRRLPALSRIWEGEVEPLDAAGLRERSDVVFLALPEALAASIGPALVSGGTRVIDLSGAFRLVDPEARRKWYPDTPDLPAGTCYALPEWSRDRLPDATLASCPGCYPTAALLAWLPLVRAGLVDFDVVIDAKSGVSGAGKAPRERTHFSENHGSVAAYNVFEHRHVAEMEQALGLRVTFVPHLVPLNRGILETIYGRLAPGATAADVEHAFSTAYSDAPFVRVRGTDLPEIKHVAYTPFCDIGWRVDATTRRTVMVACLDNLMKGAASQAVQVFNVMIGCDEREGLL
jgi:N-acetyl-gamma-glutamyl-phosphate reductase